MSGNSQVSTFLNLRQVKLQGKAIPNPDGAASHVPPMPICQRGRSCLKLDIRNSTSGTNYNTTFVVLFTGRAKKRVNCVAWCNDMRYTAQIVALATISLGGVEDGYFAS